MLTGNANLKSKVRMDEWKEAFTLTRNYAAYLMLSHHGAAANFNHELLTYAEGARYFVTVNEDDFQTGKRPPEFITKRVNHLFAVSEDDNSCIAEISGSAHLNDAYWRTLVSRW